MTEIAFDELEIKDRTGVRIVNIDEEELSKTYDLIEHKKALEYWNDIKAKVGKVTSENEHGIEAMLYYLALKKLIADHDLEGITVKCYPKWMGKVCLPYSILSREGIVCGCEGDVNNTISMKILYELSSMPIHNTDLLYPDEESNTILFSHCGSGAFCLASSPEDITLGPVRLADKGVCSLFPVKTGIVILINLVGRKSTFRMSVMKGEAVGCGMEFPGNPLKVNFKRDINEINREIAEEGVGHHWMAGYGDMTEELRLYCDFCDIKHIRI